jgi:hypothetical protein
MQFLDILQNVVAFHLAVCGFLEEKYTTLDISCPLIDRNFDKHSR